MPALGSLWYTLGIDSKQIDADLKSVEAKLKNLGVTVDVSKVRQTIEASVGATPFNATVNFGNARASLDAIFANKKYDVHVEAIASKLHESIKNALANFSTGANILPKKKELRKAVNDALLSAGFEINIGKVKGLNATINNALGSAHTLNVSVDPKKLASAIDKAVGAYKGGKQVSVEVKDKILKDSITAALKTEKFPIRVIVDKAEAQDAVRQALQAAGLQSSTGFTASDKRAWDAQSRRMEAEARAAAASALAQRRLAGARTQATNAADKHATATVSLNSALKGNITLTKELGGAIGAAYSVVALKNFMTKVVEIGGELEKQKLAMKAILGDEGMANTISSQINTLAVKSPFGIMELNQYAKQLTAFQIPYNELYDTMKRMADVSAAVGVDMGRIILAYGQVRAAKFLKGTELRQFTEANIPLIDMLAERFTKLKGEIVSAGDIMDMISNKEVSFEDVKAVLWELTGEGGRFYNMQEVLSESVSAKWKNLADAIDLMFADIADSTSGPLKGLAEILTELTSRWSTIASVASVAAIAFGGVKVASLLTARSLDASGSSALKAAANSALLERNNARLAQGYRTLTRDERKALGTSLSFWQTQKSMLASLSGAQFRQLALTGQITKEEWSRMIALGRLNDVQKKILVQTGVITQAELGRIRVLNRSLRTLEGWKRAFLGVGNAARSVGRALGALFLNPVTAMMAAIGTVTALWQRNSEEADKADQMGKDLFTKATEGARNLGEALRNLQGDFTKLDEVALQSSVSKMEQIIKDYSPEADKILFESYADENGLRRSAQQRAVYLRDYVEEMQSAYDMMKNLDLGGKLFDAIDSEDEGHFLWGLFNDNLKTDIADFSRHWRNFDKEITAFATKYPNDVEKIVKAAQRESDEFENATDGMKTYSEMFRLLLQDSRFDDLEKSLRSRDGRYFSGFSTRVGEGVLEEKGDMERAAKEVENEMQGVIKRIKNSLDWDFTDLQDEQKMALSLMGNKLFEEIDNLAPEAQRRVKQFWEDAFGIEFDESRARGLILEAFQKELLETEPELAKQIKNGEKLDEAALSKVDEIFVKVKKRLIAKFGPLHGIIEELIGGTDENGETKVNADFRVNVVAQLDETKDLADWQKTLVKQIGEDALRELNITIKGHSDINSFIDEARKGYKAANEAIKELKPILIKAGIDFTDGEEIKAVPLSLKGNEIALQAIDEYNKKIRATKAIKEDLKAQGTDLDVDPNKNQRASQKDPLAESLKQRFKDIKDAWSEFQKWSKTEGREAAATRIGESGLFSTLSADKIPQTVEEYRALVVELENELRQAGVKGTARESLLNDLLKQLLDIDKTVVDEQLKLALDKVSKEAERQLADWNLFDKIRKATGNQGLAMSIAFGMNTTAETDYPAMIKQQLQKTVEAAESALSKAIPKEGESPYKVQGYTYDKLKELYDARDTDKGMQEWVAVPEDIRKAWEKANGDILKYFDQQRESVANILNEYQTLQDKISAINAKRNLALETINAKNERGEYILSDEERAKRASVVNTQADYDIFTQSNDYLRFFNDIYGLTMDEANRIGDLIQLNLNRKLQDGLITIYDYEQQMEKVRKQLEALRNVKSDAMTFLTGGLKGLNQKKLQKAEGELANNADYQKALKKQIAAQNALNKAQEDGDEEAIKAAEAQLALANQSVKVFTKIRDAIIADQEKMQNILDVTNIAANIAGGMSDAFNTLRDMADSFGFDTESNAWETAAAVMDTLTTVTSGVSKVVQSAMNGDIGGVISGTFDTLLTPFTIWNKLHDKKLQKMIERSKEAAQIMQNQYDILEKRMANFLGNAANMKVEGYSGEGGAYGKQRELMQGQLAELEKQRQAEIDKKKTDDSVVADYDKQIEEMKVQIRQFAEEAANDLYGIDLKGWASELGDALFEAWKKGEDGAEAFKRKAGEILGNVMNEVLKLGLLEPMMEDVQKFLFGEDGKSGAFGSDFELTPDELEQLAGKLMAGMEGVDAYNSALDQLEKILNEKYGLSMKGDEDSKSGLSAGIQSLTEDTGSLVASYCNGIRGDVSVQTHDYWPRLLDDALPQMNVIAQSQLDTQRQIAENTLRNAVAAEAIQVSTAKLVELNDQMGRSWRRIAERNWGYS